MKCRLVPIACSLTSTLMAAAGAAASTLEANAGGGVLGDTLFSAGDSTTLGGAAALADGPLLEWAPSQANMPDTTSPPRARYHKLAASSGFRTPTGMASMLTTTVPKMGGTPQ